MCFVLQNHLGRETLRSPVHPLVLAFENSLSAEAVGTAWTIAWSFTRGHSCD